MFNNSVFPSSTNVVLTQRVFYGQTTSMAFQIPLVIGSQCIGFCFGGILRRFVVWPSNMIWPYALSSCAFFNTLHKNYSNTNQDLMTRERFFWIATAGSFIWYWIPGHLFTGLSMFNWVCWIAPKDVIINTLFGTNTGLGMSIVTFDWMLISSFYNPLVVPVGCMSFFLLGSSLTPTPFKWWTQMNAGVGFILMIWVSAPILYCNTHSLYLHFVY